MKVGAALLLGLLWLPSCVRINFDEYPSDGAVAGDVAKPPTDARADAPGSEAAIPPPVSDSGPRKDATPDAKVKADVALKADAAVKPDVAKPKVDLPKPKPDLPRPDMPKPDAAKPDASKPDASKPDAPKPDSATPTEASIVCPTNMASFPGFCIDQNESATQSWTAAAAYCTGQAKRLCHVAEWQTACSSVGKGMTNMTGDWEWLIDIASSSDAGTSAKKAGYTDCASLSSHDISGGYRTRCCK